MKFPNKGLIDLGSNSIRFVIYKMTKKGKYKELLNVKRTARLSMHVDENKNITAEGIEKILHSLHYFKQLAELHEVEEVECVATAVIREANNQKYVLKKINKEFKMHVDVLTGFEEAYYGFLGAVHSTKVKNGVTIDIGGGSTEVTLFKKNKLIHAHSFPFGAVTLSKKFVAGKTPTEIELTGLSAFLSKQFSSLSWLVEVKLPVIGIGGTARNLYKVFQKNEISPSRTPIKRKMMPKDIRLTSEFLQAFSFEKRKEISGLSEERADIIIPGIEAIDQFMQVVKAPSFELSKYGLREGFCFSELYEDSLQAKINS